MKTTEEKPNLARKFLRSVYRNILKPISWYLHEAGIIDAINHKNRK